MLNPCLSVPRSRLFCHLNTAQTMSHSTTGSFYCVVFSEPRHDSCTLCVGLSLGVTVLSILVVIRVLSRLSSSLQKWGLSFKSLTSKGRIRFIWRKKYPSFEDMHALFDRGDALMAAVYVATTLQLAHEEVAKVLRTHSTYRTDPMRRLVRTLTFIRIIVRANSNERSHVVSWLNKLHWNIKLFELETNVFILSTIAYGLGRAHQVLEGATDFEVDALVSAIMNLAKQLIPNDRVQDMSVPTTLRDVTDFVFKKVTLSPSDLESKSNTWFMEILRGSTRKKGSHPVGALTSIASVFLQPLSWVKFYIFLHVTEDLFDGIFGSQRSKFRPGIVLSILLKLQPLYSHFHYTLCPGFLTFDGIFELLHNRNSSVKFVVDEVYGEIFGENAATTKWRQMKDKSMGAHLPQLKNDAAKARQPPTILSPSLYYQVMEHLKCSYLRGQLLGRSLPQHLGVIMDGNRRFSKQNHLGGPMEGHQMGARKLLEFMSWCFSSGVNNLTVWALSDDNLKRGMEELGPLFTMMANYIREIVMGDTPIAVLDVRFRIVGDRCILPEELTHIIDAAEKATRNNSKFNLQLALGYGGRAEATRAMKRAVEFLAREKSLPIEEALSILAPTDVSRHIYSTELGLPEIDAILRTSGECRLSGFALWETQGAEISFVEANWPALKESDFLRSIVDLSGRNRRFGA